ncbi:MAG: hypothetical protein SGJ17_13035 [Hyphomicrobiales bacterium]|nr:hypothetical protein [Hyphomicrobiales bacterium]
MASTSRMQGRATTKMIEPRDPSSDMAAYVDWAAVFAGVFVSTASALLLAGAGAALGLSFTTSAESAKSAALGAVVWIGIVTLYAAGVGGYISGRLRVNASVAPPEEIGFRDGVSGLLVWALGVLLSGVLAAVVITSAAKTVVQAGTTLTGATAGVLGATAPAAGSGPVDYLIDRAFRPSETAAATAGGGDVRDEVTRILTASAVKGSVSNEDKQYLARLAAARSGVPEAEARQRIDTLTADAQAAAAKVSGEAKNAADNARKAGALFGVLNTVITLLAGVLAWYTARIGGHHRDDSY